MPNLVLEQKQGFTIVEVVVASLLITLLGAGVFRTAIFSQRITYSNAQRQAAFGLAKAKTEELKGVGYDELDARYGSSQQEIDLDLVNLGGVNQKILPATRSTTLQNLSSPQRKLITVTVSWEFQGRSLTETVQIFLYPRR